MDGSRDEVLARGQAPEMDMVHGMDAVDAMQVLDRSLKVRIIQGALQQGSQG